MNTLIIDTSHSALVVAVAKDGVLVASFQEMLKKKHSERLISEIHNILKAANVDKKEIEEIVVTDGPGSYTGMRIGLTFVKVFALTQNIEVYTVDTLLSLAGKKTCFSMIDARSKRVFGAYVDKGIIRDERVYSLDEVSELDGSIVGDLELIDQDTYYGDIAQNILEVRDAWKHVDNVDLLKPRYLS